jgi:nitrite reductase/ring-hydroxylating ferredoxin subunit
VTAKYTELKEGLPYPEDLNRRLSDGEVFVLRGFLQRLELLDELQALSIGAICRILGNEVAEKVKRDGIEHIHRHMGIGQIAEVTNAIYDLARGKTNAWVSKIAPVILNTKTSYFYESSPSIRFITPHDYMVEGLEALESFTSKHGGGKITPHPPHRDSWVDCPANVINVWIAIGPVSRDNGLTIFQSVFKRKLDHVTAGHSASVAYHENPGEPTYFDLEAGDALVFHGEHVHSTVLNHTQTTRHVISFRMMDKRPRFNGRHYHHYLHSALAGGPLKVLAEVPANLSWRWVSTRLLWIAEKLRLRQVPSLPKNWKKGGIAGDGRRSFELSTLAVGSLRPVTDKVCVARIGEDHVIAFNRRCPHDGGDFAVGTIREGKVVCPWHSLPFDPATGESPCRSLNKLHFHETRIEAGKVTVFIDNDRAERTPA